MSGTDSNREAYTLEHALDLCCSRALPNLAPVRSNQVADAMETRLELWIPHIFDKCGRSRRPQFLNMVVKSFIELSLLKQSGRKAFITSRTRKTVPISNILRALVVVPMLSPMPSSVRVHFDVTAPKLWRSEYGIIRSYSKEIYRPIPSPIYYDSIVLNSIFANVEASVKRHSSG